MSNQKTEAPLKSFAEMDFHPDSEQLVKILCDKTQNTNPLFFRVLVAYYLSMIASTMRCTIKLMMGTPLPINMYAINLQTSGSGKGKSTNIMEERVTAQFRHNFIDNTLPLLELQNLPKLANNRAASKGSDPDQELILVQAEYERTGPMLFSFDSGTPAAVKDQRHKMLMIKAGALNLEIDEIGTNLSGNLEILGTFLELYDVGNIKRKLVKNTVENKRSEEIRGRTPANMMLFGTPSRLLNGGKVEEEFYTLLDTGYARRCFYGYDRAHVRNLDLTPEEVLAQRTSNNTNQFLQDLAMKLGALADVAYMDISLQVSREVTLNFIEYQIKCERSAAQLPEHDEMRKAELSHRHFKALKLAGAYAFIEGSPEITTDHMYYAIKLAEESGEAFNKLLTRDRPYVKLARYLADLKRPATQADLVEDLPFYKGPISQKNEMMQLAIAYGYQNQIVIKKAFNDGVEFISGEALEPTDLEEIRISYSTDIAHQYGEDFAKFDELHKLTQLNGYHWCNHAFREGHRCEDKVIPGFNIVVLDVEKSVSLPMAKTLLQDYKALFYTTKRHTNQENRYRVILPINFNLKLDDADYKEFMQNIFDWLPFPVDEATGQRSRKWMSHDGNYSYQDGKLLDVLPFIPKTSKNDEYRQRILDQQGMDNLERWVINNTGDGNRNNMLLRYSMILVDAGFDFEGVRQRVNELNNKLPDKLEEAEIVSTIMVSVSKALATK